MPPAEVQRPVLREGLWRKEKRREEGGGRGRSREQGEERRNERGE